MQTTDINNRIKEYESFCKNQNFLDLIKGMKVLTLHLVIKNTNFQKYSLKNEYVSLIPESSIINALNGLIKDGFIACKYSYSYTNLEYIADLNGIIITLNIDKNTAQEMDEFLKTYSNEFMNYLRIKREEEIHARLLRIAKSKEKQIELQKRVDKLDGLVFDGLYHKGRRVMARVASNGRNWQLSDDENDLISAIGKNTIKKGVNRVDLLKKYGLYEAKEIAPVRFNIDSSGNLKVEREDSWGEKSVLYANKRNFIQRLTDYWDSVDLLTTLLIPHVSITLFIIKNLSRKSKKILFFLVFIFLVLIGSTYGTNLHLNYIEQIWFALIALYLLIPVVILGIDALTPDEF